LPFFCFVVVGGQGEQPQPEGADGELPAPVTY
jgi:hypothetical protein